MKQTFIWCLRCCRWKVLCAQPIIIKRFCKHLVSRSWIQCLTLTASFTRYHNNVYIGFILTIQCTFVIFSGMFSVSIHHRIRTSEIQDRMPVFRCTWVYRIFCLTASNSTIWLAWKKLYIIIDYNNDFLSNIHLVITCFTVLFISKCCICCHLHVKKHPWHPLLYVSLLFIVFL